MSREIKREKMIDGQKYYTTNYIYDEIYGEGGDRDESTLRGIRAVIQKFQNEGIISPRETNPKYFSEEDTEFLILHFQSKKTKDEYLIEKEERRAKEEYEKYILEMQLHAEPSEEDKRIQDELLQQEIEYYNKYGYWPEPELTLDNFWDDYVPYNVMHPDEIEVKRLVDEEFNQTIDGKLLRSILFLLKRKFNEEKYRSDLETIMGESHTAQIGEPMSLDYLKAQKNIDNIEIYLEELD